MKSTQTRHATTTGLFRRPRHPERLALALLVVALGAGIGLASRLGAFAPSATAGSSHGAVGVVSAPGLPGIHPTHPGSVPAFTEADVLAYIHAPGIGVAFSRPGDLAPTRVMSIQFMTASAAAALVNTSIGMVAPDHLVCVEQSVGKFSIENDPHPPYLAGGPTPDPASDFMTHGYTVFDAVTGNVIVFGMTP